MSDGTWTSFVDLLVCPVCRDVLDVLSVDGGSGVLGHRAGSCGRRYPVVDGIPRLLPSAGRRSERDLVERFDREWREFDRMEPGERAALFARYFDIVPGELLRPGALVLDAGCGSGRWAAEVARLGARVIAMDAGRSVEVAARALEETGEARCVQADVGDTPIRPGTVDLAYTLGVLHHVRDTSGALRAIVRTLRPGGRLLMYVYYALDDRPAWYRAAFSIVDATRRVLSALPQPVTRLASVAIAALVYWPLARVSALLDRTPLAGVGRSLPLSFYRHLSFRTMRNDSLDRFGTPLEKRYSREAVVGLLRDAGLVGIVVSPDPPYWHATGVKPGGGR